MWKYIGHYSNSIRGQIERLKQKIRKMKDDHQDLTNRLNETTTTNANTTINIQEVRKFQAVADPTFIYEHKYFHFPSSHHIDHGSTKSNTITRK